MSVVGVIGHDVPLEAFDAVGVRVRRLDTPRVVGIDVASTATASEVLGSGIDPDAVRTLARILSGPRDLAAIVLCSDSDATQRLFYALRELHSVEPERDLPPVHLVDVLHLPRPASLLYTIGEVERLRDALGEWTGRRATAAEWADAARARDDVRRLLDALSRRRPALTGARLAQLRAEADERAPAEAAAVLRDALAALHTEDVSPLPRVALTGSSQWGGATIRRIEELGVRVVVDDVAGSSLGVDVCTREPSLEGVAERAWRDGGSAHRGSAEDRAAALVARCEHAGAVAIVSYARRRDDAAMWEVGALRRAGRLPVIALHDQDADAADTALVRRALDEIGIPT